MSKKKDIPEALRRNQEETKRKTYDKIEAAAQKLREERRPITRKNLIEASDLADSTFSKKHVKGYLLKRWAIGADEVAASELPSLEELDEEEFANLVRKVDDLRNRLVRAETKLEEERGKRKKVESELKDIQHETKILRGELDIARRKIVVLQGKRPGELVQLFQSQDNDKE